MFSTGLYSARSADCSCCSLAIHAMRPHGTGSIVNMSSRSGLVGVPATAAYASAKAAVRNHTKSVALWCLQEGLRVRCNSVHPAAIDTGMWSRMHGEDGGDPGVSQRIYELSREVVEFQRAARPPAQGCRWTCPAGSDCDSRTPTPSTARRTHGSGGPSCPGPRSWPTTWTPTGPPSGTAT